MENTELPQIDLQKVTAAFNSIGGVSRPAQPTLRTDAIMRFKVTAVTPGISKFGRLQFRESVSPVTSSGKVLTTFRATHWLDLPASLAMAAGIEVSTEALEKYAEDDVDYRAYVRLRAALPDGIRSLASRDKNPDGTKANSWTLSDGQRTTQYKTIVTEHDRSVYAEDVFPKLQQAWADKGASLIGQTFLATVYAKNDYVNIGRVIIEPKPGALVIESNDFSDYVGTVTK